MLHECFKKPLGLRESTRIQLPRSHPSCDPKRLSAGSVFIVWGFSLMVFCSGASPLMVGVLLMVLSHLWFFFVSLNSPVQKGKPRWSLSQHHGHFGTGRAMWEKRNSYSPGNTRIPWGSKKINHQETRGTKRQDKGVFKRERVTEPVL